MTRMLLLFTTLALVGVGCGERGSRDQELAYLRTILPDPLLEHAHVDVPSKDNIAVIGEGPEAHLALGLLPGQSKLHGGIRAEVSVDFPHREGDTVRYEWRFMVPTNFVSDAPKNRWCLIGQWHDQPNRSKNESWDGFPSRSPPVLVGLGETNGSLAIGFAYGPKQSTNLGPLPIRRGEWHRIAMVIHWSQGVSGTARLFLDDMAKPALVASGPNMHNAFQHYLKFGMYRHPDIATENWIHVDDVKIEKLAAP